MLRCCKSDERSVEPLPLPVCLRVAPTSGVSSEPVDELVVSNVLRTLVCVASRSPWSPNQSQSKGVVLRLVGSILAVGQDCRSEFPAPVGQVDPLVRWHFELLRLCGRTLDRTDVPVVGSNLIGRRQRESRLESR